MLLGAQDYLYIIKRIRNLNNNNNNNNTDTLLKQLLKIIIQ